MANPYFDHRISSFRFIPLTLVRSAAANARLDEVSAGFDAVKVDMDLKAPSANPTFTGTVTFNTTAVNVTAGTVTVPSPGAVSENSGKAATTAWVQSLVGSLSVGLPNQATHAGKYLRTNGTSASWELPALYSAELSGSTAIGASLSSSHIRVTAAATLTLAAPATLADGWYAFVENASSSEVTLAHTSGNIDGLASYIMHPGEIRLLRCNGVTVLSTVVVPFRRRWTVGSSIAMPPGYRRLGHDLVGGGGGGASGARQPSSIAYGGPGGGGGGRFINVIDAPSAGTTITINVGAGGAGAAARTTDGNAVAGTAGTASSLVWSSVTRAQVQGGSNSDISSTGGGILTGDAYTQSGGLAPGWTGGNAGSNQTACSASFGGASGGSRRTDAGFAGFAGGSSIFGGGGGGGGGWFDGTAARSGGAGGKLGATTVGGGGSGGGVGLAGGTAADSGGGGGGGNNAGNGGNGGNGTGFGSGGGGGGGVSGAFNSGAGGSGANGYVELWGVP